MYTSDCEGYRWLIIHAPLIQFERIREKPRGYLTQCTLIGALFGNCALVEHETLNIEQYLVCGYTRDAQVCRCTAGVKPIVLQENKMTVPMGVASLSFFIYFFLFHFIRVPFYSWLLFHTPIPSAICNLHFKLLGTASGYQFRTLTRYVRFNIPW